MSDVVALGTSEFVHLLELGGARRRVVGEGEEARDVEGVRAALDALLSDPTAGLVLLDAAFVKDLPEPLYRRAFYSRAPEVVALGGRWNEVLRKHVRRVIGADLLAPRSNP